MYLLILESGSIQINSDPLLPAQTHTSMCCQTAPGVTRSANAHETARLSLLNLEVIQKSYKKYMIYIYEIVLK